jgi:hypothetical protein
MSKLLRSRYTHSPLIYGGGVRNGGVPFALTFLQAAESDVNINTGNNYDFVSQNIGVADPTRVVIAALSIGGPAAECTAVTIGGVSAAKAVALAALGQDVEIWTAAVPTGTTATVVITVGGNALRARIALFRMVGGNATATSTGEDDDAGGSTSASITIPSGGAGIGVGANNSGGTEFTWGNASEVDDASVEAGNLRAGSAIISASAVVTLTGANDDQAMALAAWGP